MRSCLLILNSSYGVGEELCLYHNPNYETILDNIISLSSKFYQSYTINDAHEKDDQEFSYLPPHFIRDSIYSTRNLIFEKKLKSLQNYYLTKKTVSPLATEHNRNFIMSGGYDNYCVVGFNGCIDVLATCLSLIDLKQKVYIKGSCIGDFSDETLERSLQYLRFLNIQEFDQ